MKRKTFFWLTFWFAAAILAGAVAMRAHSQSDQSIHVKAFPGGDVGTKVANAMQTCPASGPCILIIDASLANFPAGTIPSLCGTCSLADYRNGAIQSSYPGVTSNGQGADAVGRITSAGINVGSLQGSSISPVVNENFARYANGTVLNSQTAASQNSAWSCSGQTCSSAVVENGWLTNNNTTGNWYLSLPNTATLNGTAQPITTLIGTLKFCSNVAGTYDPTKDEGTLIATSAVGSVNTMLHLAFGNQSWGFTKRINGGSFVTIAAGFYPVIPADCATAHMISMNINQSAGTVQFELPDGEIYTYPSAQFPDPTTGSTTTDADIATIDPIVGMIQTAHALVNNGADVEWGSVAMGGPSVADRDVAQGFGSPASMWAGLQGQGYAQRQNYSFILPAGSTSGYYLIASGTSFVDFLLDGRFTLTASNSAVQQKIVIQASSSITSNMTLAQDASQNAQASTPIFDSFEIANDGSANIGLYAHLASAYASYQNQVSVHGEGQFVQPGQVVLSTPYTTNVKTIPITTTVPQSTFQASIVIPSGTVPAWATIFTGNTQSGGNEITGDFLVYAYGTSGDSGVLHLSVGGTPSNCWVVQTSFQRDVGSIYQARCSGDGSSTIHVDLNFGPYSGTITLGGSFTGDFALNQNPTLGATPLADQTQPTVNLAPGLSLINPLVLPPSSGYSSSSVNGLPACTSANDGQVAWVTDANAYHGTATAGGSIHAPAVCSSTTWLMNGTTP